MSKHAIVSVVVFFVVVAAFGATGMVTITPLGSHAGEFCRNDRALIFEDPTGVRILWDPGRTIAGETDDRLGTIHVMLLSHLHTDHIGEVKKNPSSPGTCANPGTVSAAPNSNAAAIAAAKNVAVLAAGEMQDFMARKIQNVRSATAATAACPAAGLNNEMVVPRTEPCTASLRPGGSRTVRFNNATAGVKIATVPAFHSNGIPSVLIDSTSAPGTGYAGDASGAVIQFTNGLVVYLTGDTGMFGDMDTIIRRFYKPTVAVVNIPDTAAMGADEAAFAVRELIKPRTVIVEHPNEGATAGGTVSAGTRTERFIQLVKAPRTDSFFNRLTALPIDVLVPLSDRTIQCDGDGRCQ